MDSSHNDGADDTDELLCTDVISDLGFCSLSVPRDHCDLLLDAIDAQLSRLQTSSHGQTTKGTGKTEDVLGSACLDGSASVSKDTGLGNDKTSSIPDMWNSHHVHLSTGRVEPSKSGIEFLALREDKCEKYVGLADHISWHTNGDGEDESSKREQCLWRLERLLGAGIGVTRKEKGDEEDSVHTEDFSSRFLKEILEPTKFYPTGSVLDTGSMSSDTTLLTKLQITSRLDANLNPCVLSFKSPGRQLAGVPLKSFDLVTIDSDLDSVCTTQVQHHLPNPGTVSTAKEEEGNVQNGLCVTNTQEHENLTVCSEDEVNSMCQRRYRTVRSPGSVQCRHKINHSRRTDTSFCSRASTASQSDSCYVELSLADFQQKVAAVQDVERLREEVEQAGKEQHTLQLSLTHTRTHSQLLRSELHKLQDQRDLYIEEVKALQESQAALQKHLTSVHHEHRHGTSGCASALEREEMDRLLDKTKSELFSEQRRFRHTLDSIQEKLEEVTQELEQKQEQNKTLQEKCFHLQEKLNTATKTRQELQEELLLLAIQEEKNQLKMEIRAVREEHQATLTAALIHADKQKEVEREQLRTQMTLRHVEELQRVRIQVHDIKEAALREQTVTHTRHTESLQNHIQLKEEEVNRLQECLDQQQDNLRRREEDLKGETKEQVKMAVEQEQRKWEEQQVRLEKQIKDVQRRERAEVDKEKRRATTLQNKLLELQKNVADLKNTESKHKDVIRVLNDKHQTELHKLRRQLLQEAENEVVRLKERVKQSEQELQASKADLVECERFQQGAAARHEQQASSWAQDIHTECVRLQELLAQNGFTVDSTHLSHSVTVSEAVQMLQSLRKSLQCLISNLQNRITSLTHSNQQLSADKEEALCVQRDQLLAEKEKAVNVLREKLIQEHVAELSSLTRVRLREDDAADSAVACLHRQLQAKDEELRQVQRNMAQWKEKTTARLTCKIEQQLMFKLERNKNMEQRQRLEQLVKEMRHLTASTSDITQVLSSSASSAHTPDTVNSHDFDSYKLLHHLQSRIRQLQADSQIDTSQSRTHTYTPNGVHRKHELSGSYLETIVPAPDSQVTRQNSDLRPAVKARPLTSEYKNI